MKGKIIILYSADKHSLERKGKWLTKHLMKLFPLVEHISNKKRPFNQDDLNQFRSKSEQGMYLVVEDYSVFHQEEGEIHTSLRGIEILLDGHDESQSINRLKLLELAIKNGYHVVNIDNHHHTIRQHIWDCIEPLLKTPGGIYHGVFCISI